jgi:UDP-glucose 4-epimerase
MLYVDIEDVCQAYERFAIKILKGEIKKGGNSLTHIVNVYYPNPITILELAQIVQKTVMKLTNNAIQPRIEIIDTGQKPLFREDDKNRIKINIKKAINFLGLSRLKSPEESIEEIVKKKLANTILNS